MKFCAGDFLLNDALWLGRPIEVDSDQVKILIENNQHFTTWKIADILKISLSTKFVVKMKTVSFMVFYAKKNLNELFGQPN